MSHFGRHSLLSRGKGIQVIIEYLHLSSVISFLILPFTVDQLHVGKHISTLIKFIIIRLQRPHEDLQEIPLLVTGRAMLQEAPYLALDRGGRDSEQLTYCPCKIRRSQH